MSIMGSTDKFCLRWNDFESNISVSFRELREDKDFFDITLACEDEQIQAHKVILSACSPFFRSVLKRNRHEHPLLYLKGVKFTELEAVLNFMYQGEVNVAQEDLNSFLAVAEDLKVKGLTQSSSTAPSPPPPKSGRTRPLSEDHEAPTPKRPRVNHSAVKQRNIIPPVTVNLDPPSIPVKSEPVPPPPPVMEVVAPAAVEPYGEPALVQYGDEYGEYEGGGGGYGGEDQGYDETMMDSSLGGGGTPSADGNKEIFERTTLPLIQSSTEDLEGKVWTCVKCGKRSKNRANIQNHAEVVHTMDDPHRYACHVCGLRKGTFKSVWKHIYRVHREVMVRNQPDHIIITE